MTWSVWWQYQKNIKDYFKSVFCKVALKFKLAPKCICNIFHICLIFLTLAMYWNKGTCYCYLTLTASLSGTIKRQHARPSSMWKWILCASLRLCLPSLCLVSFSGVNRPLMPFIFVILLWGELMFLYFKATMCSLVSCSGKGLVLFVVKNCPVHPHRAKDPCDWHVNCHFNIMWFLYNINKNIYIKNM